MAVLSVAANSRGMSRCHCMKDEMFSLSLVFHCEIIILPVLLLLHVMLMWPHTNVLHSFCHDSRFDYTMLQKICCERCASVSVSADGSFSC